MNLQKLIEIQTKLKAPKNIYNDYGGFNYRSAEGILEAVKPYLSDLRCALTLTDSIIERGGKNYVEATATLWDEDGTEIMSTTACARECDEKKKMDASQITGATSSYARKYALNGLFDLDDTKGADTNEYHEQKEPAAPVEFKPAGRPEKPEIKKTNRELAIEEYKKTGKPVTELAKEYKVTKETTDEEWEFVLSEILNKIKGAQA